MFISREVEETDDVLLQRRAELRAAFIYHTQNVGRRRGVLESEFYPALLIDYRLRIKSNASAGFFVSFCLMQFS